MTNREKDLLIALARAQKAMLSAGPEAVSGAVGLSLVFLRATVGEGFLTEAGILLTEQVLAGSVTDMIRRASDGEIPEA